MRQKHTVEIFIKGSKMQTWKEQQHRYIKGKKNPNEKEKKLQMKEKNIAGEKETKGKKNYQRRKEKCNRGK